MDKQQPHRSNFVRNGEGTSSVRLRRRKDQIGQPNSSDFTGAVHAKKLRNRHSGDFYQWNSNNFFTHLHPASQNNPIVIPVNRFSMFENPRNNPALISLDDRGMETLDRRIPEEHSSEIVWKKVLPVLSRPPLSGTGLRLDYNPKNNRRSCDLSGKQILVVDNDDIKTDVNRNVTNAEKSSASKVNSKSAASKKYHKKASSKSELQLHRNSHGFLENQSLVMSSHHGHNKSESKLLDCNMSDFIQETNTEVSLVTGVEYGGQMETNDSSASTVLKGVLWQQRDKVFSRWKERYFVLTTDYLQCFKKSSPSVMHSAASEMGRFIFKLKLTEITSVDMLDKRGYLTICLNLSKEGSKILLRKPEGIREWHEALKTCITKSRERKGLMKSTKEFWSKKQFDNSSQYSDHWLISRNHHARGNYFNKKNEKTAMVDYGFIDAPPPSQPSQQSSKNRSSNQVLTKETIGNYNANNNHYSRAGANNKKPSGSTCVLPAANAPSSAPPHHHMDQQTGKQIDHPSSGFGTKDSSDSKSHDSGIDSIEKPGRSPVSYSSTSTTKDDGSFNNEQQSSSNESTSFYGHQQKSTRPQDHHHHQNRLSSADLLSDSFASMVQMQERTPSFRRQPRNNAVATSRRPKSSYIPSTTNWSNEKEQESFGTVIQRPQITKL